MLENRLRRRVPPAKLFPTELPELQWQEFRAAGFAQPVSGVIYRPTKAPCCGVPLGGISTGCIDMDVKGVYGFSSAFNPWSPWPHLDMAVEGSRMPRKAPSLQPLLGLAVGGATWVLTTPEVLKGGELHYCLDPLSQRAASSPSSTLLSSRVCRQPEKSITGDTIPSPTWSLTPMRP